MIRQAMAPIPGEGKVTLNGDMRALRARISPFRGLIAGWLAVALGLAGGVAAVTQARLLSRIVAGVFLAGDVQPSERLGALLGIMLVRAVLVWGMEVSANAAAIRVKTRVRLELFDKLLVLGPAYVRGERSGELANVAVEGVEALHAYFSQYLPQLALAALVPLTVLAFIFPLDKLSAIILLLTAPLMPLFMVLIGGAAEALTRKQWKTLSRLSAYFLDVLQGMTTLKVFGRAHDQVQVIARLSDQYRRRTMEVLRVTFLSALALELLSTLSTAIVAVEIGLRLLYGRLLFEQAFFVLLLAPEFYLPLRLLGARFHAGMAGLAAADHIGAILAETVKRPERAKRVSPAARVALDQPAAASLSFERVGFSYPDRREALVDLSFELRGGQLLALVGPSGAGKSTLASLLLRFIEPERGQIKFNGLDISQIPPDEWRRNIAWVPQHPYLFHDTILSNIRLARPEASQEEIVQAARRAHAHEFIQQFPDGYETMVGEKGARLSGGQVKRIALARAFLKNAPILVLDEATSNLDPEQEALIRDSAEALMAGRMTLVIAHRLATVYRADQILVLDEGRLVEQGTHAGLIESGGLYHKLVYGNKKELDFNPSAPLTGEGKTGWAEEINIALPETGEVSASPFGRLLKLIAPFAGWIALAVLLGAATIGSSIGLMAASAYIISAAALHPSIADLQIAIVGVRAFGMARGVFRYLERYISHQVTFKLLARWRVWFFQALEPLAPARLMGYRGGDLLSRAISDIAELENFYVRALAPPLVAVAVALVVVAYLYSFDPELALTLLVFFFTGGVGVAWLARWLGQKVGKKLVEIRAALNAALVDGIQGLADLLAFGSAQRHKADLTKMSQQYAAAQMRMARLGGFQSALSQWVAYLATWAILAQSIRLVSGGKVPGVYLAVLVLVALTSFEAVIPLPLAAQYLGSHLAAASRLFQIVDDQPAVRDPAHLSPLPESCSLEVKNLRFGYPVDGHAHAALDGLSFSLPPGGSLAVVGPSGAGKTTLVNLLLRFWDYAEGSILLAGKDLCSYRQDDVRRLISLVSQDTYLFNATVRDNLLIARPGATEEELTQAARQAQIHDFILTMPEGYDTRIGERGLRLSSGERQRLAIARALLKDAPLLILDEPTANLDTLTERQVLDVLYPIMAARTTLVITHRLVGLEAMDEILVLDRGRIVERGRHVELLNACGLYHHMWDLQNQVLVRQVPSQRA